MIIIIIIIIITDSTYWTPGYWQATKRRAGDAASQQYKQEVLKARNPPEDIQSSCPVALPGCLNNKWLLLASPGWALSAPWEIWDPLARVQRNSHSQNDTAHQNAHLAFALPLFCKGKLCNMERMVVPTALYICMAGGHFHCWKP